jgi:AbrB family looped-hinge helix DNA binding protein
MSTLTVSHTGQITLPRSIRERLFLRAGDELELTFTETGDLLLRPVTRKVDEVYGRLHRPGQPALSPEDMEEAIRERNKERPA